MSGTAMIPESQGQRGPLRWSAGGGIIGVFRGLALAGLMLAGLLLLLVPLMAVFLTAVGAGVLIVGNGPSGDHRFLTGAGPAGRRAGHRPVLRAPSRCWPCAGWPTRSGGWPVTGPGCRSPCRTSRRPAPATAGYRSGTRLLWLASDPATWRDLLWVTVNALRGLGLAALPAILAGIGLIGFIYRRRRGDRARLPGQQPRGAARHRDRVRAGRRGVGAVAAAGLLRPGPLDARPDRAGRAGAAGAATWPRPGPRRWTAARPRSAGSSGTCTTARRPGWWPWA